MESKIHMSQLLAADDAIFSTEQCCLVVLVPLPETAQTIVISTQLSTSRQCRVTFAARR